MLILLVVTFLFYWGGGGGCTVLNLCTEECLYRVYRIFDGYVLKGSLKKMFNYLFFTMHYLTFYPNYQDPLRFFFLNMKRSRQYHNAHDEPLLSQVSQRMITNSRSATWR